METNRLSRRQALRAVGVLTGGVLGSACARRVRPYVLDPAESKCTLRHYSVNVSPDRG